MERGSAVIADKCGEFLDGLGQNIYWIGGHCLGWEGVVTAVGRASLILSLTAFLGGGCYPWIDQERYEADNPVVVVDQSDNCLDPVPWFADIDADGFGDPDAIVRDCKAPPGFVAEAGDCHDGDSTVFPGALEVPYDGLDNDCSGGDLCDVDGDGLEIYGDPDCPDGTDCDDSSPSIGTVQYYPDDDLDGFGDEDAEGVLCQPPGGGYVEDATDCDDGAADVNPGAEDLVIDQFDSNCDGVFGRDDDGDGFASIGSGGTDCNDSVDDGFDTHVGADDFIDNGIDNNCDGIPGVDDDGDSYPSEQSGGDDCDDLDPMQHVGADEYCNSEDDDCDGVVDDSPVDQVPYFADTDGDGFGDPDALQLACEPPSGHVVDDSDCADDDGDRHPGVADLVADGIDNNCDGVPGVDSDGDGYPNIPSGGSDCADSDAGRSPGEVEVPYDGIDQDCTGLDLCDVDGDGLDADVPNCGGADCDDLDGAVGDDRFYVDGDGDGFGDAADSGDRCVPSDPTDVGNNEDCDDTNPTIRPDQPVDSPANGVDDNCDGVPGVDLDGDSFAGGPDDCDDADPLVYDGAPDYVFNNIDNNCDGVPGVDDDGDGEASEGSGGGDCDDGDPLQLPGAPEYCNLDDDDCNGLVDDLPIDEQLFYDDTDGDSYGDSAAPNLACSPPPGTVNDDTDCDDTDPLVHPGAADLDATLLVDLNCDGVPGVDADGDGYAGVDTFGSDCDDGEALVHPAAVETPYDGVDQDCDGGDLCDVDGDLLDHALCGGFDCDDGDPLLGDRWYHPDADGDSYGDADALGSWCAQVDPSDVVDDTDCDDTRGDINPGAVDPVGNGEDNNCDGIAGVDADGDSMASVASGGLDCDDSDPLVYDGAPDFVVNGIDNDCDGAPGTDGDGDGEPSVETGGLDCDDADPLQNPTAAELCNGEDDDCDGQIDIGTIDSITFYLDNDGDGFGNAGITADDCSPPSGYVGDDTDCDDSDPLTNPAAIDDALDGIDQNCDGLPGVDADLDGQASAATGGSDCDDTDPTIYLGAPETAYDTVDQDCDGSDLCDVDTDGYADPLCGGLDCDDTDALVQEDWYFADSDGDGSGDAGAPGSWCVPSDPSDVLDNADCDDGDPSFYPGAPDLVDGFDQNCDGIPGVDADGDSNASVASGGDDCDDGDPLTYSGAPDYVPNLVDNNCDGIPGVDADGDLFASALSGGDDCDDADPGQFPGATEFCNDEDDDCDGIADNNTPIDRVDFYLDWDGDGYGDLAAPTLGCDPPSGYVVEPTDCDDTDPLVHPGVLDDGTGGDPNCDGVPGVDADGDGQASEATLGDDCDDADPLTFLGASEIPYDGVDQDCSGADLCDVDADGLDGAGCGGLDCDDSNPGIGNEWYYPDFDGDGYGDDNAGGNWCVGADPSDVADDSDCDDIDPLVNPGAPDLFANAVDNNCDGVPGVDADSDGFADLASGGSDCDDGDPGVAPGQLDFAGDGVDTNCDGVPGVDGDGDGDATIASGGGDCDDGDPTRYTLAADVVGDGIDTNCDGVPGVDADGDGYADIPSGGDDCDDTDPLVRPGAIDFVGGGVDNNCDGVPGLDDDGDSYASEASGGVDCDDTSATVYPAAPEICDGLMNDCDSPSIPADETDADGDGYVECTIAEWAGVAVLGGEDCDDSDFTIYLGAPELCDGLANDCAAGAVPADEVDDDGDGYVECIVDVGGWHGPVITGGEDCDDAAPERFPLAADVCDGLHTDCALPDLSELEIDDDGDGYVECTIDGGGWFGVAIAGGDDCDDLDLTARPDAIWYADADGDGFGDAASSNVCGRIDPTDVAVSGDCDDLDPQVYPHAVELCDGLIQDCSVGVLPDVESDLDGDGYVTCSIDVGGWLGTPVTGGDDCDDRRPSVFAGAMCSDCTVCTITVPSWRSIQDAVTAATPGATVCVEAGTYVELIDFGGKDICLVSVDGPATTIIDGGGAGTVVTFSGGEGPDCILDGFTITNGSASDEGGGIGLSSASPTLRDLVITGNYDQYFGGGLLASDSTPWLFDVTVSNNTADWFGGGLHLTDSAAMLSNVTVTGNTAIDGAGLSVWTSDLTVSDSAISGNISSSTGGGIYADYSPISINNTILDTNQAGNGGAIWAGFGCDVRAVGSQFTNNQASSEGGAVYLEWAELAISDSDVSGNSATFGGGVHATNDSTVSLRYSTLSDNSTSAHGAGIFANSSTLDIANVFAANNTSTNRGGAFRLASSSTATLNNVHLIGNSSKGGGGLNVVDFSTATVSNAVFAGNSTVGAPNSGGAIMVADYGDIDVIHTTLVGNTAPYGAGIHIGSYSHADMVDVAVVSNVGGSGSGVHAFGNANSTANLAYCNVWDNDWAVIEDPTGTDGNISADPSFLDIADPDPLNWDTHIAVGSPMENTGAPFIADPNGSVSDIGAYGGPRAEDYDLDADGYPEWWQPGPYNFVLYPLSGWDCDDTDAAVYPGNGC